MIFLNEIYPRIYVLKIWIVRCCFTFMCECSVWNSCFLHDGALDWCTKLGTPASSSYAFHFLLWSHPRNTPTFLHTNDESISHLRYGTRSCLENWRMLRNSTRIMVCLKKGTIHFFVSALQVTTRPPPAMVSDSMGENRKLHGLVCWVPHCSLWALSKRPTFIQFIQTNMSFCLQTAIIVWYEQDTCPLVDS